MRNMIFDPFWAINNPINVEELAKREADKKILNTVKDVRNSISNLKTLVQVCADALLECDDCSSERVSETLNNYVFKELAKAEMELSYL